MTFDHAARLRTPRLTLTPLAVEDAEAMLAVYANAEMFTYTGGEPPTLHELSARYTALARGASPDGTERWCNWIVRLSSGAGDPADHGRPEAIGAVQATITDHGAAVAWEIGVAWQGRGYAVEAVRAMVDLLRAGGVCPIDAFVHPDHEASAAVARHVGLVATEDVQDGERRWTWPVPGTLDRS